MQVAVNNTHPWYQASVQEVAAEALRLLAFNAQHREKVAAAGSVTHLVALLDIQSSVAVKDVAERALRNIGRQPQRRGQNLSRWCHPLPGAAMLLVPSSRSEGVHE